MNFTNMFSSILQKNSESIEDILEYIPAAFGCLNSRGHLIAANAQWLKSFAINRIEEFENILVQPYDILIADYIEPYIYEAQIEGESNLELRVYNLKKELVVLSLFFKPAEDNIMACAYEITGYKTALRDFKEKTREYEGLNSIFFDASPFALSLWDDKLNITDCNLKTLELFDLNSKEEYIEGFYNLALKYQPCGTLSKTKITDNLKVALKNGNHRFEFIHSTPAGKIIPTEIISTRIKRDGRYMLANYLVDLSSVKENIQEETDADKRAMLMLDATPIACYLVKFPEKDDISTFEAVYCNKATPELFGFSSKQEALTEFNKIFPKTIKGGNVLRHMSVGLNKGYHHFEYEHKNIEGELFPCEITMIRINYGGDIVLACYLKDLRPIKNAILKERETLRMTQMFMDSAPFFIEIWNEKLHLVECNQTAVNMFELKDSEEYMRIFDELSPKYQPDGRLSSEKIGEIVQIAFDKGYYRTEWMHIAPDGSPLPVDVVYVRLKRGDENIVVGYNMDLRQIRAAMEKEKEAEKLRAIAEDANKAKTSFLSTVSHEIRTPMNAILGITEIQLMNPHLDIEFREALEKIYVSGDLLLSIINDILDLSKIEAGKLPLLTREYEIASLISDVVQLNLTRIGSKQIEFNLIVGENTPMYMIGDELRIKQVLNNLLSNAFKYTEEGEVALVVNTFPIQESGGVTLVFSVSDTGVGMTEEQVAKLFDEYSRFNEEANRATEGTGLGMSITRNLVELMEGQMFIQSEPGKGSTFAVHLPQGNVNPEIIPKEIIENLQRFRLGSRANTKGMQISREPMPYGKILIVDDVETNIYVAKGLMVPYELKIDSSPSGFDAIEKIGRGKTYDIIFMDHMMPEMDGMETTAKIREMGYTEPIVALTANAVSGQAQIFMDNGFDDFLSKPIDVRQLNMVLNKLIRDRYKGTPQAEILTIKKEQDINLKITEIFARDATKSLKVLREVCENHPLSPEQLKTYAIHVHGIKSASANIGRADISDLASRLEEMARTEDFEGIEKHTPSFLEKLQNFTDNFIPKDEFDEIDEASENRALFKEKLALIKIACEDYDTTEAEEILTQLNDLPWSKPTKEVLSTISTFLLRSDFDEIVELIEEKL